MTVTTPPAAPAAPETRAALSIPRTPGARLRRLLADSLTMAGRGASHWRRNPGQLAMDVAFPVMMLVMFAYFLGGAMAVEDGDSYREFLVPGMFALIMAFGLESTMVALTQDINKGLLDRFRSLPIAPSSILVGRSLIDMAASAMSLVVMIGAGLLVGWRWNGSVVEGIAAIALLLLLRFSMLWAGIYLALIAGRSELVQAVQILVWPTVFLSNAFISPDTMPNWLGTIADWNPMSAAAGAVRELFGNPTWTSGSTWPSDNPVLLATLWPLVILAVCVPLAIRRFTALSR